MGILSALFGGSKSTSGNKNDEFLKGKLGGAIDTGVNALNSAGNFLSGGFGDYLSKGGFNEDLAQGLKGITGTSAAQGLLRSGSAGQAFTRYGTDLRKKYLDNFLGQQLQLGQLGLGGANVVAGTGQTSKGTSNGGIIPGLFG